MREIFLDFSTHTHTHTHTQTHTWEWGKKRKGKEKHKKGGGIKAFSRWNKNESENRGRRKRKKKKKRKERKNKTEEKKEKRNHCFKKVWISYFQCLWFSFPHSLCCKGCRLDRARTCSVLVVHTRCDKCRGTRADARPRQTGASSVTSLIHTVCTRASPGAELSRAQPQHLSITLDIKSAASPSLINCIKIRHPRPG